MSTEHAKYVGTQMADIGRVIEELCTSEGQRVHFVALVLVDGVCQSISNMVRDDRVKLLHWHAEEITNQTLNEGPFQ